jgi:hypothetical protein
VSRIFAIDPGNTDSAYVVIDHATRRPLEFDKLDNWALIDRLYRIRDHHGIHHVAVEMVASYGMPVGADVFETCVWIGRFAHQLETHTSARVDLVKRHPVKLHHCHNGAAKDSNIAQALKDRFAPGQPNHGKGTKAAPGWFHGFAADIWQAYALAVYVADKTPLPAFPVPSPAASAPSPEAAAGEAPAQTGALF